MSSKHLARIIVFQTLYEWDFWGRQPEHWKEIFERNINDFMPEEEDKEFAFNLLKGVVENLEFLDEKLKKACRSWSYDILPIMEKNILRISSYELYFQDRQVVPPKVAINEAIELAKNFINEKSAKFINGVLATIYNDAVEKKIEL